MTKWIIMAIVIGPITTFLIYVVSHLWLTDPKRIKARGLKRVKKSQQQFCDW